MRKLRNISFFAGIGGFDLGLEQAGIETVAQVEIDEKCRSVLERHFPKADRSVIDVRDAHKWNMPDTDVCTGGFPCQDLSVAGLRAGLAGKRSGLYFEFHRFITETFPKWVVIENVPGLLSSNAGKDFAIVIGGLTGIIPEVPSGGWGNAGIAKGPVYSVAYRILDAQYFGLAQRRKRVFIVASLGTGNAAKVLLESEGGGWNPAPGRETRPELARDIAASLKGSSGERGFPIEWEAGLTTYAITERTRADGLNLEMQKELAYSLTNPGSGGRPHSRLIAFDKSRSTISGDIAGPLRVNGGRSPGVNDGKADNQCILVSNTLSSRMGRYSSPDPATGKGSPIVVTNTFNGYTGGADDNDAQGWHLVPAPIYPTLRGQPGQGPGRKADDSAITGLVRRLTPVECERLQGFPDGHTAGQSDSSRYRQLGNAVAVPVARWIGERIVRLAK